MCRPIRPAMSSSSAAPSTGSGQGSGSSHSTGRPCLPSPRDKSAGYPETRRPRPEHPPRVPGRVPVRSDARALDESEARQRRQYARHHVHRGTPRRVSRRSEGTRPRLDEQEQPLPVEVPAGLCDRAHLHRRQGVVQRPAASLPVCLADRWTLVTAEFSLPFHESHPSGHL